MRAAIYARVSSDQQDATNQVVILEAWAKERGWQVVEVYQESESAWKAGHQRELARLVLDARRNKFEIVLCWSLDRLSREGAATILNLIDALKPVRVFSHQEPWTEAPGLMADILFSITAWTAMMESQRRSERTKAGLSRAVANGKVLGRPSGSKDKGKRKRTGYLMRYARKERLER